MVSPSSSSSSLSTSGKPPQLVACVASVSFFVLGVLVGRGARTQQREERRRRQEQDEQRNTVHNNNDANDTSVTSVGLVGEADPSSSSGYLRGGHRHGANGPSASTSSSVVSSLPGSDEEYSSTMLTRENDTETHDSIHILLAMDVSPRVIPPRGLTIINGVDVTQAETEGVDHSEEDENGTIRSFTSMSDPVTWAFTNNRLVRARNLHLEILEAIDYGMDLTQLQSIAATFTSFPDEARRWTTSIETRKRSTNAITGTATTPTITEESTSTSLDCPICLTEMILPRVGACGHTLCTPCLLSLCEHERRPSCPVCRRRFRPPIERMPINFAVKACVEERVSARGEEALQQYRAAEAAVMPFLESPAAYRRALGGNGAGESGNNDANNNSGGGGRMGLARSLRPAWSWIKWSVLIVTELGAFIVSMKELMDANQPQRNRRYQRIV